MLVLTLRQYQQKLPAWVQARLAVAVIGPPGTGKTYTSIEVIRLTALPFELVDGGKENDWKALFPYKTPTGGIEPGKALLANGGVLVIDEFNRVPPELKTSFQLLASEKKVPWPDGGYREVDLAIVATANPNDLGVEEAARAELDRYDLIVELRPTPEELHEITAKASGVKPEVADVIVEAVNSLSGKLDPKKFHQPEGLRMMISIAKILRSGTLGSGDAFKGAAERCFPLGRRGAERTRAEFDQVVADAAGTFAGKLANVGQLTNAATTSAPAAASTSGAATFQELAARLADSLLPEVSNPALQLPLPFVQIMHMFTQAFGAGVALHLMKNRQPGQAAEKRGVKLHFGANGAPDSLEFRGCPRHQVEVFLRSVLAWTSSVEEYLPS